MNAIGGAKLSRYVFECTDSDLGLQQVRDDTNYSQMLSFSVRAPHLLCARGGLGPVVNPTVTHTA